METSLHRQLKEIYADGEARVEALKTAPLADYAELVIAQAFAPGASSELKSWIRDMLVRNDKRAYTQVLTEGLSDFDVSAQVAEIDRPTLVVIGELDGVIPPDQGRELAKRIQGAQLVEIEGVGQVPSSFVGCQAMDSAPKVERVSGCSAGRMETLEDVLVQVNREGASSSSLGSMNWTGATTFRSAAS